MYSAGILPYTIMNGSIHFLLGLDSKEGCYSDFGGRSERDDDNDPSKTAIREFHEESCGAVLSASDIYLDHSMLINSLTYSNSKYYMYVLHIPWSPHYSTHFLKISNFLRHIHVNKKYLEKSYICWFSFDQLQSIKLRPIFRATFMRHKEDITAKITEHNGKMGTPWVLSSF
jgi:hypothetical protein